MAKFDAARRRAVNLWRWTDDRTQASTVRDLTTAYPEMTDCKHEDVNARAAGSGEFVIIHAECLDCPKSVMTRVRRDSLLWPGEMFEIVYGMTPDPEDRPEGYKQ